MSLIPNSIMGVCGISQIWENVVAVVAQQVEQAAGLDGRLYVVNADDVGTEHQCEGIGRHCGVAGLGRGDAQWFPQHGLARYAGQHRAVQRMEQVEGRKQAVVLVGGLGEAESGRLL